MIVHERISWMDPARPVDGAYRFRLDPETGAKIPGSGHLVVPGAAPKLNWSQITHVALHYTAAVNLIDGDPGELQSNIPAYLRAIQSDYTRNRAYSVGYNWAVDWLGDVWTLRGFALRTAAHAPANDYAVAILCLVDGADETTPLADGAIRNLVRQCEMRAIRKMIVTGHGQLQGAATACPGEGIKRKIAQGVYKPDYIPPGTAPNPTKEDDMATLIQVTDGSQRLDPAVFSVTGTMIEWIATQGRADSLVLIKAVNHNKIEGVPPAVGVPVDRGFLQYYTLIGQSPAYPTGYTGPRTSPADFARWVS